jgi:hypothetical protein
MTVRKKMSGASASRRMKQEASLRGTKQSRGVPGPDCFVPRKDGNLRQFEIHPARCVISFSLHGFPYR